MRILTWAVRQALTEASQTPDHAARDNHSPEQGELIPCAPAIVVKRTRSPQTSPTTQWTEQSIPQDLRKCVSHFPLCSFLPRAQDQSVRDEDWAQRYRLFRLFDAGIQLDHESWFSVTPECIAQQIAERCACNVVVDAFCGAGGNAIQFAMTCLKVIAIDIDPEKIRIAKANAKIYDVDDTIEFICTDFIEWIQQQPKGGADVIFLSPPWGGIEYLRGPATNEETTSSSTGMYSLSSLLPVNGSTLFTLARRVTPDVAMYLPRNTDLHDVSSLAAQDEMVEVEEAWMGRKCKALTVYFAGLVANEAEE